MYGISWHSFFIAKSCLSNRDQYIVCNEYKSNVLHVNVRVLQGSVLFPCGLVFFINDISQLGMKNVLFADDAIFYAESVNFHELVETIQGFVSMLFDCLLIQII